MRTTLRCLEFLRTKGRRLNCRAYYLRLLLRSTYSAHCSGGHLLLIVFQGFSARKGRGSSSLPIRTK
jgi:hypothetical protein